MNRLFITLIAFLFTFTVSAQVNNYADSLKKYQDKYTKEHGVVRGKDKENLHFFPINKAYNVKAVFERVYESAWFKMETSGKVKQTYRRYGTIRFSIHDTSLTLNVYQSEDLMKVKQYADYLFIPFTDITNGEGSYENGRYIDITIEDVKTSNLLIDFNKAYNPYCAYVSGVFNCPIPPKENNLSVAIAAGEMKYGKAH
jgi:uncharacterized protein